MSRSSRISFVILCVFFAQLSFAPVCGAADDIGSMLRGNVCGDDWPLEESVRTFNPDTLFEHINGEAELYFPYGFEALAAAIYTSRTNPQLSILADVYRMSSPLNAFGIYSNYRKASSGAAPIGAEGFASSTQLMFYQDRYVVRLQSSGPELDKSVFLACARAVSQNLPPGANPPGELAAFRIPGVVPRSERYIARSLLGYAFFRRGITADAMLGGERAQVFIVLEDSRDAAVKTFESYLSYLKSSGKEVDVRRTRERISLRAFDPMYGGVFAEPSGRYVIGVVRLKDPAAAEPIVERMRERILKSP